LKARSGEAAKVRRLERKTPILLLNVPEWAVAGNVVSGLAGDCSGRRERVAVTKRQKQQQLQKGPRCGYSLDYRNNGFEIRGN